MSPGKLADHLIVMAKGEALEPLGERDAGIQVVEGLDAVQRLLSTGPDTQGLGFHARARLAE